MLHEYLYIDERRLQHYAEQLGVDRKAEKTPLLSAEVSLVGPSGKIEHELNLRQTTSHERIGQLMTHLKSQQDRYQVSFGLETCIGVRVFLPSRKNHNDGLGIWLCRAIAVSNDWGLILLEDGRPLPPPSDYPWGSSALTAWMDQWEPVVAGRMRELGIDKDDKLEFAGVFGEVTDKLKEKFSAIVSPPREITTLYLKKIMANASFSETSFRTYGYPIVIAAGGLTGFPPESLPTLPREIYRGPEQIAHHRTLPERILRGVPQESDLAAARKRVSELHAILRETRTIEDYLEWRLRGRERGDWRLLGKELVIFRVTQGFFLAVGFFLFVGLCIGLAAGLGFLR